MFGGGGVVAGQSLIGVRNMQPIRRIFPYWRERFYQQTVGFALDADMLGGESDGKPSGQYAGESLFGGGETPDLMALRNVCVQGIASSSRGR